MKKWYRKSLCLVLIVCLLSLTACKSKPTSPASEPTQAENTPTQATENTATEPETTPPPANQQEEPAAPKLNWKTHSIETQSYKSTCRSIKAGNFEEDRILPVGYIHRMTYETWKEWADYRVRDHGICQTCGYCYRRGNSQNPVPCLEGEFFRNNVYSQEYFAENTLLALDVEFEHTTSFTFKEVRYENNVLTCVVERPKLQLCSRLDNWVVFVEIDSALPEDTELKLEYAEIEKTVSKPDPSSLPKTLDFTWQDAAIYYYALFEHSVTHYFQGSVYGKATTEGGHTFANESAMSVDLDNYKIWNEIGMEYWLKRGLSALKIKEPETYLQENGLILINLKENSSKPFALTDVSYKDGVLTCSFTFYEPPEPAMASSYFERDYLFFVAVDALIPKGTEIKIERNTVTLETEEEFRSLLSQQRKEIDDN